VKEIVMARGSRKTSIFGRREALKMLGVLVGGSIFAGCDTMRVAFRAYPREFDLQPDLSETILKAFVGTVVPGAPTDNTNLARIYFDEEFPFAPYSAFLASDLCDRSEDHFGVLRFDHLAEEERPIIIRSALRQGGTTGRLYTGAVFLAQVSFYAGIYDDHGGCELIDFPGRNRGPAENELSYPNPESYLPRAATTSGSPG
jgi:hypothetical protein